jgi:group I intron endonuclease
MKPKKIIYKVTCTITNEVYIGATGRSIEERKQNHEQKAEKGVGSYFQNAIATYGPDAFTWEQIDTANSVDELAQKERTYVFKFKSFEQGFNGDQGGGLQKSIHQYGIDKSYLNTFGSLEQAAEAVDGKEKSISNACLGYNVTYRGCYWSYIKNDSYAGIPDRRKKKVTQFTLLGNTIANFHSVAEASRKTGISKTSISRCCRGEREQTGGFIWKYI